MTLEDLQNVYIRVLSKMENPYQVMILLVAMYKAVEQRQLPSIIFVLFCVLAIKFYPDECRPVVNRIFARLKNGDIVTTK